MYIFQVKARIDTLSRLVGHSYNSANGVDESCTLVEAGFFFVSFLYNQKYSNSSHYINLIKICLPSGLA